jgi:hypothetical protein
VKKIKLTLRVLSDATNVKSNASIISSKFGWGMESGLIVGYMEIKESSNTKCWSDVMDIVASSDDPVEALKNYDMRSGRIQSCYSVDSAIAAVGSIYMDAFSVSSAGSASAITALSFGGICGGSETKAAANYIINTCYASGNKYFANITPSGSDSGGGNHNIGTGFYHYGDKTAGTDYWYSVCNRAFFDVQLNMCTIVAGADTSSTINNSSFACRDDTNFAFSVETNYDGYDAESDPISRSDTTFWAWEDPDYPDGYRNRFTRYGAMDFTSTYPAYGMCTASLGSNDGTVDTAAALSFGFVYGKVIKTNPVTGELLVSNFALTVASGDYYNQFVTDPDSQIAKTWTDDRTGLTWTLYNENMGNRTITYSTEFYSEYCVRGQY